MPKLTPPQWVISLLLLATLSITAWWLAGGQGELAMLEKNGAVIKTQGSQDLPYCKVPQKPRPVPRMDSPFGQHLYADVAAGKVHLLPSSVIARQLAPPIGITVQSTPLLKSPSQPINETGYDDVQSVASLLEEYRRAFGAMPQGELNDEIVRRLQGENPKGVAVLPKQHANLNAEGELMDRWGTAYRFHPETAWLTTVRSAGPDKKMWTSDDILSAELDPDLAANR
jgi:hypothetical protein